MLATVPLALLLASATDILIGVYWACLIIGGGMLLFSVLGGLGHGGVDTDVHGGLDFHTDVGHSDIGTDAGAAGGGFHADAGHVDSGHANVGHAHGGHAGVGLSTWFSIRFVVFFLAFFGAVGVVLTYVARATTPISFGVALAGGLIVGQSVHQLFRALRRSAGNSTPQPQDYVNRLGRVTIGINGPATGEVLLQVRGGERYVPAVARSADRRFAIGDEVVVVAYRSGVAEVVSRPEYERTRSA
jgi:hypothetical protein